MRKTIVGMAMMAMALVGFNGMAQNTTQCNKAQVENVKGKKGMKKDAREKKNPYEGLTLSDAQKSKLADLDKKMEAKRQAKMEARKKDAGKQDFKNMTDAERQAAMQARNDARKAEKVEYLQEVKEIVGPDQYVVFLENFYVNGAQHGGKAFMQGKDGRKGMAHMNRGQKGGKGQKGQRGQKGGQRGQQNSASGAQS